MAEIIVESPELDEETRKRLGLYYTDPRLARKLVSLLPNWPNTAVRVLEPSAGRGSFIRAIKDYFDAPSIFAVEKLESNAKYLEKKFKKVRVICDDYENITFNTGFDYIIGNPPYLKAEEHIRHSFELIKEKGYLAFLLRLNFLGSQKRIQFWKQFKPKAVYPISERPSFFGSGTDQTEYAFYVWQKGWTGKTELEVIQWRN